MMPAVQPPSDFVSPACLCNIDDHAYLSFRFQQWIIIVHRMGRVVTREAATQVALYRHPVFIS